MQNLSTLPTSKKLVGLDHLRALAITLVLLYHYRMFAHPQWVDDVIGFGWTGVDLFFVLSGFLISSQLFEQMAKGKAISLPEFFIKRFFRIIPPYLLVLAIYVFIPAFHEREQLPPLWKFLTFTQNFGLDIKTDGTFSHVWSLCVEEHFYLLLPLVLTGLVAWKVARKGWILLPVLFLAGFVIRWYCWQYLIAPHEGADDYWKYWYMEMYYPTYNRLDGLLAGVAGAALFTFLPSVKAWIIRYSHAILVAGLLVLTGAWFLCEEQKNFWASILGYPVIAIGYSLLVLGAVSPGNVLYRFNSRITALIAKLSFVLYLSHKGVIHLVQPLFEKAGLAPKGNAMLVASLLAAVAAAFILNKLVEAPCLRLRQRILQKRKGKQEAMMVEHLRA
ncbi:MAG: acyltransferase [Chitinophaga sp.]|uniref:acyltransferase family protein n=1 Tax=Chitinophaga sp. TaxID=1869181 RepID=UPI001B17D7A1|nr:acyltransferase [Chitinophaga sp.]MBO9728437.1 acyltransferase [Chitinophaga sp.]